MIISVGNKAIFILLVVLFILFVVASYFLIGSNIYELFGGNRNYRGEKIQDYRKLPVVRGLNVENPNSYFDGPLYLNKNQSGAISLVVIEGVVNDISYTDGVITVEKGGKKNRINIKNNDILYAVENNPSVRVPKRTPANINDIKIGNNISYNPPELPEGPATIIIVQTYK